MVALLVLFVLTASAVLIRHIRRTDIHGAIDDGDLDRVRATLARRPGLVDDRKEFGTTPLLTAAAAGHGAPSGRMC